MAKRRNNECGVPDAIRLEAACQMPFDVINVYLPGAAFGFSAEEMELAWSRGCGYWTEVVDLKFNFQLAPSGAHIIPVYARIDGPGGVLAWSDFPCPWQPPLDQRYDIRENYSIDYPPTDGISLPELIAHEVGHALGISHQSSRNVMYRTLRNQFTQLGPEDRAEALLRYNPAGPEPPDPDEPPAEDRVMTCLREAIAQFLECLQTGPSQSGRARKQVCYRRDLED